MNFQNYSLSESLWIPDFVDDLFIHNIDVKEIYVLDNKKSVISTGVLFEKIDDEEKGIIAKVDYASLFRYFENKILKKFYLKFKKDVKSVDAILFLSLYENVTANVLVLPAATLSPMSKSINEYIIFPSIEIVTTCHGRFLLLA